MPIFPDLFDTEDEDDSLPFPPPPQPQIQPPSSGPIFIDPVATRTRSQVSIQSMEQSTTPPQALHSTEQSTALPTQVVSELSLRSADQLYLTPPPENYPIRSVPNP